MTDTKTSGGRRRPRWVKAALAASLVLAGVAGAGALANGGGHGWGPGRGGGEAMMKARTERVLSSVDATPTQRAKIEAIIGKAASDLAPARAAFGDARTEFASIMTAGKIDRAAAEVLRAERIAEADAASKRMLTAALDAAEVLSPEQRARLMTRFAARGRG